MNSNLQWQDNAMQWHHSLDAPRSLLTGPDISISAVEDPGFIQIFNASDHKKKLTALLKKRLLMWPHEKSNISEINHGQFTLLRNDDTLWAVCEQSVAGDIEAALKRLKGEEPVLFSQLTGHYAALRIAGSAAAEVLAKICSVPLHYKHSENWFSFIFLHAETLVIPERDGKTLCWHVYVPRSEAPELAERLISASLLQPRIGL